MVTAQIPERRGRRSDGDGHLREGDLPRTAGSIGHYPPTLADRLPVRTLQQPLRWDAPMPGPWTTNSTRKMRLLPPQLPMGRVLGHKLRRMGLRLGSGGLFPNRRSGGDVHPHHRHRLSPVPENTRGGRTPCKERVVSSHGQLFPRPINPVDVMLFTFASAIRTEGQ